LPLGAKAADNVDAQHGQPQNSARRPQFHAAALGATGFYCHHFQEVGRGGLFVLPASAIGLSCFNDRIAKEMGLPHGTVASFISSLFLFLLLFYLLFVHFASRKRCKQCAISLLFPQLQCPAGFGAGGEIKAQALQVASRNPFTPYQHRH
jgi:hypothetical protein